MNPLSSSSPLLTRSLVLVGMMGAGKSSVGRRLAQRLNLPFFDADTEIETAAGMTISQFFAHYGEEEFRLGERRVIARLLEGSPHILATGGGAFMDDETRSLIREKAHSLWIKADPAILLKRVTRHNDRPLLQQGNPREIMARLQAERDPTYATADFTVQSDDHPVDETVDRVMNLLRLTSVTPPLIK